MKKEDRNLKEAKRRKRAGTYSIEGVRSCVFHAKRIQFLGEGTGQKGSRRKKGETRWTEN